MIGKCFADAFGAYHIAPSILMMLTSFTRIVVVLHFTRAAIGTQTVPPNQVIVGFARFFDYFYYGAYI